MLVASPATVLWGPLATIGWESQGPVCVSGGRAEVRGGLSMHALTYSNHPTSSLSECRLFTKKKSEYKYSLPNKTFRNTHLSILCLSTLYGVGDYPPHPDQLPAKILNMVSAESHTTGRRKSMQIGWTQTLPAIFLAPSSCPPLPLLALLDNPPRASEAGRGPA